MADKGKKGVKKGKRSSGDDVEAHVVNRGVKRAVKKGKK